MLTFKIFYKINYLIMADGADGRINNFLTKNKEILVVNPNNISNKDLQWTP